MPLQCTTSTEAARSLTAYFLSSKMKPSCRFNGRTKNGKAAGFLRGR